MIDGISYVIRAILFVFWAALSITKVVDRSINMTGFSSNYGLF